MSMLLSLRPRRLPLTPTMSPGARSNPTDARSARYRSTLTKAALVDEVVKADGLTKKGAEVVVESMLGIVAAVYAACL